MIIVNEKGGTNNRFAGRRQAEYRRRSGGVAGVIFLSIAGALFSITRPPVATGGDLLLAHVGNALGDLELPRTSGSIDMRLRVIVAEDLAPDPAEHGTTVPASSLTPPVAGCFSVVRIQTHAGDQRLSEPGHFTFRCDAAPAGSRVFGWINEQWHPIVTEEPTKGAYRIPFLELTTYALFPSDPRGSQM